MSSNNLHLKDSPMSETAQCEQYSTVKPKHFLHPHLGNHFVRENIFIFIEGTSSHYRTPLKVMRQLAYSIKKYSEYFHIKKQNVHK